MARVSRSTGVAAIPRTSIARIERQGTVRVGSAGYPGFAACTVKAHKRRASCKDDLK
jgi:hypothetical protein